MAANAETIRFAIEAWNRHDLEGFLSIFAPNCETLFRPEVPDPGPYYGVEGVRTWAESFLGAFPDHRAEIVEMIDSGDDVVVVFHHAGRGSASGAQVDMRDYHLFVFQGGKVRRWLGFSSRAEAVEAAGGEG